jgi:hypothetical protein
MNWKTLERSFNSALNAISWILLLEGSEGIYGGNSRRVSTQINQQIRKD